MDLKDDYLTGSTFVYSKLNHKLIAVSHFRNIAVVDLKNKRVDFKITNSDLLSIVDTKLFGRKEDKLAFVSFDCKICLFLISYDLKSKRTKSSYLIEGRDERGMSMAVSDQGEHERLLVGVSDHNGAYSSRLIIFKVEGHLLQKTASIIDQKGQGVDCQMALSFYLSLEKSLFLVGLSYRDAFIHLYQYDSDSEKFRELKEKRIRHSGARLCEICHFGGKLFYGAQNGCIQEVRASF